MIRRRHWAGGRLSSRNYKNEACRSLDIGGEKDGECIGMNSTGIKDSEIGMKGLAQSV